jgi:hypothetical protein
MAEAKKLRYKGPFAEVAVPALGKSVKRNHQVEVKDAALAKSLLAPRRRAADSRARAGVRPQRR